MWFEDLTGFKEESPAQEAGTGWSFPLVTLLFFFKMIF